MRVIDGQLVLFGGLCPACGVTSAYVKYQRRIIKILLCAQCDQAVQDLACGYTINGKGAPRSDHRG
jgi:hypothetical protein